MEELYQLAAGIGRILVSSGGVLGTAESCTGGMIAMALTEIPGSSAWFQEGLVTYANESKQRLLDVPEECLLRYGAVSEQVVTAMTAGVLRRGADFAVATSGIAGPGGGTPEKPVGTVWLSVASARGTTATHLRLSGDRHAIRVEAARLALKAVLEKIESQKAL